jgi:hypothetical protein
MPETMAKSVGLDDLKIPAKPPKRTPDMPATSKISHRTHFG